MKIAMISPDRESEKAISGYTEEAVKALKKNKVNAKHLFHKRGSGRSFFKLFKELKKYEVVHVQHEYNMLGGFGIPYFFVYLYFLFFKRYKVVTSMHTIMSMKQHIEESSLRKFFRKTLYFFQNRLIGRASDLVFVHSDFFVPILTNDYKIPRRKIKVFPQGIIEGVPNYPLNFAKKKLGLKGPIYLVMGNLQFGKGTDILLKNAKSIEKTLLIVSSPDPVNDGRAGRIEGIIKNFQNYVEENNLKGEVKFDIRKLSDQMPIWWEYLSACDLFMLPYRAGISSGMFTHAMAAKKPVIASNIPFFKDVAKKYDCVKLVKNSKDYGKAIKESLKPKNYKKMIKGCEKYLKDNSWRNVTKRYNETYQKLLKE